jgi:membrane protein YqaA with SNARE-associated domain
MVSRAASALAVLLPGGFRDRQRDEWLGDLLALSEAGAGRGARLRYLMGAAYTLPILRRQVRRGRSAGGLHARLGRPGSKGVVWAAVFVSLVTGFLGACAAEAVAWSAAPGVPDLRSVAPVVFPSGSVQQSRDSYMIDPAAGWREYLTGSDDEDQYGVQSLWQSVPATTRPDVWLDASRDRLEADGWTVHGVGGREYAHSFWASNNGYAVEVGIDDPVGGEPTTASATVTRTPPWWMAAVMVLAAGVGAFGGWMLTGWVSRRTAHRHRLVRAGVTTLTSTVLVFMVPQAVFGLQLAMSNILVLAMPTAPPWVSLFKVFGWAMFATSLALTAVVILIASTRPATKDDAVTGDHP